MIKKIKNTVITSLILLLTYYRKTSAASFEFKSPLQSTKTVSELVGLFMSWIVQLGTIAAVLAFVYVGFQFVAAKGKPDQIKHAKDAFMWTVVGTLVLIAASVLVEVVKATLLQGGIGTAP